MKVQVIGSEIDGKLIQGVVKVGAEVVITHRGKVKRGEIVRTKSYNRMKVSYDKAAIMINNETSRVKGPISKGIKEELRALCSSQI